MCHASRHQDHHYAGRKPTREERQRDFVQQATKFGMVFMLCLGISMLTGFGLWPLWVLLFGAFVLAKEARVAYGSSYGEERRGRAGAPHRLVVVGVFEDARRSSGGTVHSASGSVVLPRPRDGEWVAAATREQVGAQLRVAAGTARRAG